MSRSPKLGQALSLLAFSVFILLGAAAPGQAAPPVTWPGTVPDYFTTPNWAFSPPLTKFKDPLPSLPVAVPDTISYPGSDYYEIDLVEVTVSMHSDMPLGTRVRIYKQVNNGTDGAGANTLAPPAVAYLGPVIVATKDRPVRVKFTNRLAPEASGGRLFVPVDDTIMGSGEWDIDYDPVTKAALPRTTGRFTENRAVLHLHGGRTPWISDGTPHQWITPAAETADGVYSQGVSATNVPDMPAPGPGSQTYYWTNQQSARLMFYHDHSWGITRLNVYVGEAAGYLITDSKEQELIAPAGPLADVGLGVPLVIQDKTFVDAATIGATDPTWNWGTGAVTPGAIVAVSVTAVGSGYTFPTVGIVDLTGPGSGATAVAEVNAAGNIIGVTVTNPGANYVTPQVTINPVGGGAGATATATLSDLKAPKTGDLWWPHVYMPAQNPYNPDFSGINAFGRWHYGPWFWPPTPVCGSSPLAVPPWCVDSGTQVNPYYDCWYAGELGLAPPYDTDGPCTRPDQPPEIPGTPVVSWGAEAFLDTMTVNGTAYPTYTVDPKPYRFRILNASHDRFLNLQLYQAVSKIGYTNPTVPPYATTDVAANLTEVAMVPAVATPGFPTLWPTDGREGGVPDPNLAGPAFIQIGSEGGFLPAPVLIPNQPVQWNLDPTMFNVGNVLQQADGGGAIILGPAERADVIVDFSKFGGKTLILYNDAPTAFPALDPHYDYYTGAPDRTDMGAAPAIPPGVGPNNRTTMQIVVRPGGLGTAPANDHDPARLTALRNAFKTAGPDGVFKAGQDPIIVGQKMYGTQPDGNSAYANVFPATYPWWGVSRISDTVLRFKDLAGVNKSIPMKPKAIHDEMGGTFDNFGRMSAKLGLEVPSTTAAIQTFALQNFVDPPTEILDSTVDPDGIQIWKITHNGVDTHPIHFHLFDVQLINRVGWDGFIRLPDPNELGWKDTVRMAPLEDTIVALRPILPRVPFGLPTSWRPYNPATYIGSDMGFSNIDTLTGGALAIPTLNAFFDFGWEYVWHCHILSHEENDMMRPITYNFVEALPATPVLSAIQAAGPQINLSWTDGTPIGPDPAHPLNLGNPANEIGFEIQRFVGIGPPSFTDLMKAAANATAYGDGPLVKLTTYSYRVRAYNALGTSGWSNPVTVTTSGDNVAPSFTKGGDQSLFMNSGPQTVAGWATAISAGPADESWQVVNFIVTNDNNALFSQQPAIAPDGTLTFTSATGVWGVATVTVRLHDNGGTVGTGADTSAPQTFTITIKHLDPLQFTAPMAGDNWQQGSVHNVTWLGTVTTGYVYIQLFQGATPVGWVTSWTPNNGTFTWTVPATLTPGSYTMRIVWYTNAAVFNTSGAFTVSVPTLTVTQPDGIGPVLQGSVQTVAWSGVPYTGNVYIYLYQGANYAGSVTGWAPNTGAFNWTVPAWLAPGSYRARVFWYDNSAVFGTSAAFTVVTPTLTVTQPSGPVLQGSVQTVAWSGIPYTGNVYIYLYQGASYAGTVTGWAPNTGTFNWTVPAWLAPGAYTARVTWYDNTAVFGTSPSFTIGTPTMTVTQPSGPVLQGSVQTVAWSGVPYTGNVYIYLYQGPNYAGTVTGWAPNTGTFNWTVPAYLAPGAYTARVYWYDNTAVFGTSPVFNVATPTLTVTQPSGSFARGTVRTVAWSGVPPTGYVYIYLYQGASYAGTVTGWAPNTGSFSWSVPTWQTPGVYTARVTWYDNAAVSGASPAFTITP